MSTCVCVHARAQKQAHVHITVYLWRSEDNLGSQFSLSVGPQDPDQVDKLDDKDLYLLSHLTCDSIFDSIHSRVCHVTEYVPSFQG